MGSMYFYDDRYRTEMHVSYGTFWHSWEKLKFIVSDDARWVRIDQPFNYQDQRYPYSVQKIDALARKLVPGARVVGSKVYGLPGEVETWSRTYKVR